MSRARSRLTIGLSAVTVLALVAWLAIQWLDENAPSAATGLPQPQQALVTPDDVRALPTPDEAPRQSRETPAEAAVAEIAESSGPSAPHVTVFVFGTDRQPIPKAIVEITGEGRRGSFRTDAAGLCELALLPGAGVVDLRISAEGYVDWCLRSGRMQRIDVVLRRSVDVKGRITAADDGSPVADARITLASFTCEEPAPEVLSAADGRFELRGLPLDLELEWRVHAEGFRTLERSVELREGSQDVVLSLARGVLLEFLVVDALAGSPIAGATISRDASSVTTDENGSARSAAFLSKGDGEFLLVASTPRYCSLRAVVRESELTTELPLRMPLLEGVRLWGQVVDTQGAAVPAVTVTIDQVSGRRGQGAEETTAARNHVQLPDGWTVNGVRSFDAVTDETGRYEIQGLEPLGDRYQIGVLGKAGPLATRIKVPPLGPPGTSLRQDIVLQTSGSITGSLTLNGKPASGNLFWRGPTRQGSARVDASGAFRIENVEAGTVDLTPSPDWLVGFQDCRDLFAGAWSVNVTANATASIDIALELELSTIAGRVADSEGNPQQGVLVSAFSREACWRGFAQSELDGTFEFPVRPGAWGYQVSAGRFPNSTTHESVAAGTRDLELVLPGSASLRLRVVDSETRRALTGFVLCLEDQQGKTFEFFDVIDTAFNPDPQGWFETNLRPGSYRIFVGDYPQGGVSGYLPVDGGTITVEAKAPAAVLELERQHGLELAVTLAEDQEPLPGGLSILLLEKELLSEVTRGERGWQVGASLRGLNVVESRRIQPDSHGMSRARALRQGTYRFVAFPDTIWIEPAEVVVTGNEREPVEIRWKAR